MHHSRRILASVCGAVVVVALTGCGGSGTTSSQTGSPTGSSSVPATSAASGCGVTLADVQAVLPSGTPVGQHDTPDPARCNFTWEQDGRWGIDVVFLRGGRAQFEASDSAPAGPSKLRDGSPYEVVTGVGETAFATGNVGSGVTVVAMEGTDVVIVDVVYDGSADQGPTTPLGLPTSFVAIDKALATKALAG